MAEGPPRIRQALDQRLGYTVLREAQGSVEADLPLAGPAVHSLDHGHGGHSSPSQTP